MGMTSIQPPWPSQRDARFLSSWDHRSIVASSLSPGAGAVAKCSRYHHAPKMQTANLITTTAIPASTANCHHAKLSQPALNPAKPVVTHKRHRTNLTNDEVLQPVATMTDSEVMTYASATFIREPSDRDKPSRIAYSLSAFRSSRLATYATTSLLALKRFFEPIAMCILLGVGTSLQLVRLRPTRARVAWCLVLGLPISSSPRCDLCSS